MAKDLQKRLIEAEAGEQILLPEGTFHFKRSISLNDTPEVTIKGAGKGKTILSFKSQIEGAEGIFVKNVNGITLEGFTVADSKGDAIKVQDCENVVMRDLEVTWTNGQLATYGISEGIKVIRRRLNNEKIIPPPKGNTEVLAHLGIRPDLRGYGLGTKKGRTTTSLDVSVENLKAMALYKRLGFQIAKEHISHFKNKLSYVANHFKMFKNI